jgi:precorrin-6B C5,15-methyltransferase / cobalt-precorrin-6B C5,C15-methyltransferase
VTPPSPLTVVGVGADGWSGLTAAAQVLVESAEVLVGGPRALAYIPDGPGERVPLPTPLVAGLPDLLTAYDGRTMCFLASGDPMLFGIGSTLVRLLGPGAVRVVPHPSSVSLACARLGWPVEDTDVLSAVGRPLAVLRAGLAPGRRLLVLSAGRTTPAEVAALLVDAGYGPSAMTVLAQLGGPGEHRHDGLAGLWAEPDDGLDALNVVAVTCVAEPGARVAGRTPGLPDEAYDSDGQLTKREVRAVTLARLVPLPGQLLWDVGGGSGSVGIEWMRAHPAARAVSVEVRPDRAARIAANACALGVPGLEVVVGAAPAALAGLPAPDAVFVGGGARTPDLLDTCWAALRPGGRLVVNAVTLETEALLVDRQALLGGDLVRLEVSRASGVGRATAWRPAMPVTMWTVTK